mmetsp:Transcript_93377/g.267761  ORF Transcript_93377/g.267761 Transcript_93377/m.267761 type:complete len:86 (-) Transcript_93377:217-474(-)
MRRRQDSFRRLAAIQHSSDGAYRPHPRDGQQEEKCIACYVEFVDRCFVPCGHMCVCGECPRGLDRCPICRREIIWAQQTFLAGVP